MPFEGNIDSGSVSYEADGRSVREAVTKKDKPFVPVIDVTPVPRREKQKKEPKRSERIGYQVDVQEAGVHMENLSMILRHKLYGDTGRFLVSGGILTGAVGIGLAIAGSTIAVPVLAGGALMAGAGLLFLKVKNTFFRSNKDADTYPQRFS